MVAIIDRGDPNHDRCTAILHSLPSEPLLTTWSCWLESIRLLGLASGIPAQECAWSMLEDGLVLLDDFETDEWHRIRELMRQYHDARIDVVDASLVAAAERLGQRLILTLDRKFHTYKIFGKYSFDVIP